MSESEIRSIKETVNGLTLNRQVVALLGYGSQVAGYASDNSDYDIIMVLRPFRQRVRYYYLNHPVECAVLVVDPRSFENDCRKSTLGEFVSGRLLNAFEPIEGESYICNNEVAYKKRVLHEGLIEACVDYSEFASEIIFPLSYFLFEKLRKRAAIYPPVVYSYSKTYGDELLLDNLDHSLNGFRLAAQELAEDGVLEYDAKGETVRISLKEFRSGFFSRLGAAASYTNKSLRQYAVHGYAGRVRPNVVGKEVLSKISRSKKAGKLPEYIVNPKNSWSIPVGKLFATSNDWLSDLKVLVKMNDSDCVVSHRPLGELYTSTGSYTFQNDDVSLKFAVKRYHDITGMKWGVLNLWSLKNANFTTNPIERMFREYRAILELKNLGLHSPEVISVFLEQKILVTKYIEGKDVSKLEAEYLNGESDDITSFEKFGKELAKMHNHGYCMGDTKPSNVIVSDGIIYFVDLEQSQPDGNKTWDIAEFVYYSARFTMKEDRARKMIGSFIDGYRSSASDTDVIKSSLSLRYRAPFQAFIAPNVMRAIRSDLSR